MEKRCRRLPVTAVANGPTTPGISHSLASRPPYTRTHGRAPVGQRVSANTPGHWDSITLTCGLRLSGVTAALAFPGATNTDMFENYVADVLIPELKPGDVVVWDNPKPHQSDEAIDA